MYDIEVYKTESGNAPYEDFLKKEILKKHKIHEMSEIQLYINKLKEHGFLINERFKHEAIKPIKDKIYELRPGRNRILFFFFNERGEFVLLHGFVKRTPKTPQREIENAQSEYKDYIRRNSNG